MLDNKLVPNINIFSNGVPSVPVSDFSKQGFGLGALNKEEGSDFKTILSGMVSNLNNELEKPDQLLNQQMSGNSDVDIHDITTAIAKAEIGITMATQVTSKVVTAYNTIMNISI
ncbi:MAG: flagellar hook-basal body complex protein FliE [Candidatus Gastranaerophilales bacterium]|nr:flagellar hook-basal body complex protein FliE [Candidatus Gastranaerophilales bacterium]